ncbi:multidrug effflux MFS transporter [Acetobacter senegalensis]|uniref:multidrug effflux MFS transporter n=1 Tax=Acetobacter senegalensis TaxID=446692 RepID=UPI001EDB73CC|nr:multidrug effflux MFS transporter [Acetobacter senegalensis]MCG4262443.1 multidrug effflux MFS transporter [Acetobacter senegalensis]
MTNREIDPLVSKKPGVALLGLLNAIEAVAIDAYVPALPSLEKEYGINAVAIQTTLSAFFFGMMLGQAFWGPLSDRFGRRLPMLYGLLLFISGSIISAHATGINILIVGRAIQAFGASAGIVLSRAVVSDCWTGSDASRIFTILMQIIGIGSIVAPIFGVLILEFGSWHVIFWVITSVGIFAFIWTTLTLKETLPKPNHTLGENNKFWSSSINLMKNRIFMLYALGSSAIMSAMFSTLTAGVYIFVDKFHWSPENYAIIYSFSSFLFIISCQINSFALKKSLFDENLLIMFGVIILFSSGFMINTNENNSFIVLVSFVASITSLGLIIGNMTAQAMAQVNAHEAGMASSIIGLAQFQTSALGVSFAAISPVTLSLSLEIMFCSVITFFCLYVIKVFSY